MAGNRYVGKWTYGDINIFGELNDVYVGNYCSIATNVLFDCGLNHNYHNLSNYPFNNFFKKECGDLSNNVMTRGDIIIGSDVWIGRDTIIMSGVTIGDGAIVGAKSIVTKNVEPYSIVGGVPAKHIKYRFESDVIKTLMNIQWWKYPENEVRRISRILMTNDIDGLMDFHKNNMGNKMVKGNSVAYYTRSMSDNLYQKMRGTLPNNVVASRITNQHGAAGSINYLYDIILKNEYDYVINIDEDMFIYNIDAINSLLEYMIENDIDYCGMPDGGTCIHRKHSPIVVNPFFNIFNAKKIRQYLDSTSFVNTYTYSDSLDSKIPHHILKKGYEWTNDNYEPYYPFFYWLASRDFKCEYLQSYEHTDECSTILKNQIGEEIGIHTWYSREYGRDPFHTSRIDEAFELASSK